MNPIDIEKYKKDMMKLYTKRKPCEDSEPVQEKIPEPEANETQDPNGEPFEEPIPEANEEDEEIVENEEDTEEEIEEAEEETEQAENISERFPEPDLSELEQEYIVPEYVTEKSMGDSTGYILVNVRAGHGAYPIENASVMITAVVDGNRLIIASGLTDISGTTIKLETPAPSASYSQSPDSPVRPYSLFDISVRAEGYFNARSVDVPVFSGVTSVQDFNMIPAPVGMESDDETLTYFNYEPRL